MDAATLEEKAPGSAQIMLPVCPHCGDDPLRLTMMPQQFPKGQLGVVFFCGNPTCRKFLGAQLVGMAAPPEQGRIVKPGGSRF